MEVYSIASITSSSAGLDPLKLNHQKGKLPLVPDSPSSSPSTKPNKLASRVRLIDGVVPRILHKGDSLPGDLPVSRARPVLQNKPSAECQIPGLNAGPSGGAS